MKRLSLLAAVCLLALATSATASDWSRFRGPDGSGVAEGEPIPMEWSTSSNLLWRIELPGKGVSSPIVHGDRLYVTTYTGYGQDAEAPGNPEDLVRHLLAFDRTSGEELWRFSVASSGDEDPYQGFITQHGYATSTPVTDGEHVYVVFGKSGLFAVNLEGEQVWQKDLGRMSDPARWGDASSPVLVDGVVVVNAGILSRKVLGLDKATGEELWSLQDDGYNSSWSTPAVHRGAERTQVLVHFPKQIMGLDPRTGEKLWWATSPLGDATSPSIVAQGGIAYLMGSREGHGMAVRVDGTGDVSETHTVWKERVRAGTATPVIVGDALYWSSNGIFMALSRETGELVFRARLPRKGEATGRFPNAEYSSPIAFDGDKIVQFTRNGESYIIEAGREFKVLSHNAPLDGDGTAFSATPAIQDGALFVRSESWLYSFSAGAATEPTDETASVR
ncbi:MAG: PQQ-binding-like beta-propeller repeat protein [Acidobacteriota bacterium]